MGNLAAVVCMAADYRRCPPLAAGWLRLNALHCAIILITGKLLRYAMIYWGMNTVAG